MSDVRESYHKEIPYLFTEAKDKLVKIDKEANQKKKDIFIKLAKDLEGKIPADLICQKIVEQLDGIVSRSLIQNCLPEEYKQGYRVKNAKQQQQQNNLQKETNLAPVVALNPEKNEVKVKEHQKNKGYIYTDTDGMSYLQWGDKSKESSTTSSEDSSQLEDQSISQTTYKSQEKEIEQQIKKPSQLDKHDRKNGDY